MKKNNNGKFYLALVIFSLVGQVAWVVENMFLNVFIYRMFNASPEAISAMVAASAVSATVTTLLIGALSDKVGKRKLFICGGYILWGISIWSFAAIRLDVINALFPAVVNAAALGVTLVIIADCAMTFFGSSANDAAFNAWLTDSTDETNRGLAEGLNAMMPLVAILAVFGGAMLLGPGYEDQPNSWSLLFGVIGTVVLILGIVGFFIIQEKPVQTADNQNYFANIFYGFRPGVVRSNKMLYLTVAAVAAFNISIQVFMPYLIIYYQQTLKMENYVLVFAPAIVIAAVFTGLYGQIYDKKGFRTAIILPMLLLMAGYVLLYLTRATAPVFIGSVLMMCGFLGTGAILGAKVRTHTPENRSGMFQGLRIVGQVLIPGVVGPAIGAAILKNAETFINSDGTPSFLPNANIFLGAFVAILFAWLVMIPLMKKEK